MATKKTPTTKTAMGNQATARKAATKIPPPKKSASEAGDKKLSAINAAVKVLAESKAPLTAKQMTELMAAKRYWTSPGGKTPHATLYAAILREIQQKGDESRFAKVDRGQFALNK